MLVGITRVRDESLILEDTLQHFLARVDRVLLYDDCSTDNTVEIARSFDRVQVIEGDEWRPDRVAENTRHRRILLEAAAGADWCLCFDADERLEGALPELSGDAFAFRLFDGYLTPECADPYRGGELSELRRMWGPEYRDIVMLFRVAAAQYDRPGQRAPTIRGVQQLADVRVRHYGKCLSVEHWEETCRYYADHFPARFADKWRDRMGQAIHTASDFGRPLVAWDELPAVEVAL